VEFDAAWSRRIEVPIGADSSVVTLFISLDDLFAVRLAATGLICSPIVTRCLPSLRDSPNLWPFPAGRINATGDPT
jgi:hypothetical protein